MTVLEIFKTEFPEKLREMEDMIKFYKRIGEIERARELELQVRDFFSEKRFKI